MTRILSATLFIMFILTTVSVLAQGGEYEHKSPAPEEFREIPFGADIADVEGLLPVAEKVKNDGEKYKNVYYREDEKMTWAMADVISIAYYFRENKLHSVTITYKGESNGFLIKDSLIQRYGPGRQIGAQYGWTWPEFSLVMSTIPGSDVGAVIFTQEK